MSKKLIFFGAMAAILISAGAASAAVPSIASKGYVDTQVDTRMLKSADVTGTATGAITGATVGADGGLDLTRELITSADVDLTGFVVDAVAGGTPQGAVNAVSVNENGVATLTRALIDSADIADGTIAAVDVDTDIATGVVRGDAEGVAAGNVVTGVTFDDTTGNVVYTTDTVATAEGLDDLEARVTVNEGDIGVLHTEKMDNSVSQIGTGDVVTSVVWDEANGGIDVFKSDISDIGGIPMPTDCVNGTADACTLTFIVDQGLVWLPFYGAGTDGELGADETLTGATFVPGSDPTP